MTAPRNMVLMGDALARLRNVADASVDCVITSPPYFQLRDYGVSGQIGLEEQVDDWVGRLRSVFSGVARVLKPSGSLWLNLGDAYSRHRRSGAPPKSLLGAPERLLLALMDDGWLLRNKVVWAKTNPMPSSVADRLSLTYEVIYFLTRSPNYFFDLDRIREPRRPTPARPVRRLADGAAIGAGPLAANRQGLTRARAADVPGHVLGKNPGDVWSVSTHGYRGAHFATFPERLIVRPLLATCPEVVCTACSLPWRRRVTVRRLGAVTPTPKERYVNRYRSRWRTVREVGPLVECGCGAATLPGLVLDPFFGSGTVGVVAIRHGRDWLGIELNRDYVTLAWDRLRATRAEKSAGWEAS